MALVTGTTDRLHFVDVDRLLNRLVGLARVRIQRVLDYLVTVDANASEPEIENLVRTTDTLAEVHNTLRQGAAVTLGQITAKSST